jgi:hypothetical protein
MSTSSGGGLGAWFGEKDWGEGGAGGLSRALREIALENAKIMQNVHILLVKYIYHIYYLGGGGRGGWAFPGRTTTGRGGGLTVWAVEGSEVDIGGPFQNDSTLSRSTLQRKFDITGETMVTTKA